MSGNQEGDGVMDEETILRFHKVKQEDGQAPLLVAMQPGIEIPAIGMEEVVVVTEGDPEGVVEQIAMETIEFTHEVGDLGAVEEIDIKPSLKARISNNSYELEDPSYSARHMVYNRQGVKASKGPPPETSGESESEQSDGDDSRMHYMHDHSRTRRKDVKKRDFAYRLQWRNKDMMDAMKAVEDKRMTIRGAAKKFLVPYSTLKDRIHGRVRHGTKPGVKTALSPEEEEELVRYIKDMEAAGFLMRNADVRERAGELLRLNYGHSSPYGEGCSPGHNWLSGFLKRHNGVEFKRQVARSVIPSCGRQRTLIKKFYEITGQVSKKNRIQTKPERVYSVSEMKMSVFQKATIIYCASASGAIIPPFVIFKGQQKLKLTSAREAYPNAFFTSSVTGQVTEEIFLWWFRDHFLKVIPHSGNRPLVLFISQPCINVSLQMYQLAKEERVIFISIPTGVCHLLQPLDEELGSYIENCLAKKAKKWENENIGAMFTQKILAQLLQKIWKKALTVEEIQHKFSNVGIYPLNSAAISTDKILAMSHAMRETLRRSPSPPSSPYANNEEEDDDPLQGLSLLSALSSHEYASIGRNLNAYGSQENLTQTYEEDGQTPRRRIDEDFNTPSTSMPPQKRRRLAEENRLVLENISYEVTRKVTNFDKSTAGGSKSDRVPQLDVTSEIALARENLDQINRAVDSILSSERELAAPRNIRKSPMRATLEPTRSADSVRVIKVNLPNRNSKPTYTVTSPKRQNITAAGNRIPAKKLMKKTPPPEPRTTKKIIFMLNKEGQLVSRTEVTPRVNESGDARPVIATISNVTETLQSSTVFTNIKSESPTPDIIKAEEIYQEDQQVVEETVQETGDLYASNSPETVFVNAGFSLPNSIEEQPPQHLFQDEELDLDTVDTILINGQLFRVIRAPKEPVVKQEPMMVQVQLEDGTIAEVDSNSITEDGILISAHDGASVIHQEIVQDYEVASFDTITSDPNVITEEGVV